MKLIDTHSHMYLPEFKENMQEYIQSAKNAGISEVYLPNIDSGSIEALKSLSSSYPGFYKGMMGLHPSSVKENYETELGLIKAELDQGNYIAVGEIGIDLYWDKTFLEQQVKAFKTQISWAKEKNLPIVIHSRNSFDEIFEILDKENSEQLSGVFHCFTGNAEQAKKILSYGNFKLGIGGVVTFKNSGLDKTLREFGPENLVLETDAPYLAPVPYRGKQNQTAYTLLVAEKLSEIFNISLEDVARISTENAHKIFNT